MAHLHAQASNNLNGDVVAKRGNLLEQDHCEQTKERSRLLAESRADDAAQTERERLTQPEAPGPDDRLGEVPVAHVARASA